MSARFDNGRQFSQFGRGRPAWLVTFADLVALLIAFFVMMFATQRVDAGKWTSLIEALSRSLNPDQAVLIARPSADRNIDRLSPVRAIDLDYLEAVVRDKTKTVPELAGLDLRRAEDRLTIRLPAEILFDPGKTDVRLPARPILYELAGMLSTIGNRIDIVGHADPAPIAGSHFRSNWALSIGRAASVAMELRRFGFDRVNRPAGYGSSTFRELPKELTGAARTAVARRVDLIIWPTRGLR